MPFRHVVQDLVDVFSPSSPNLHAKAQPPRYRIRSLPSRLDILSPPVGSVPGLWYKECGPHGVYENPDATSSVISSSTYYTASSSLSSIRSRSRSFSDLPRALGAPMKVGETINRTWNALASTTTLAPVVEDTTPALNHASNTSDQLECSILPCLLETPEPILISAESGSESGRVTPVTETSANPSLINTTNTTSSGNSSIVVESSQMTSTDMFQCLLNHGCVDLTSSIDPEKYSSCRVAQGGFGDIWQGELRNRTHVAIKVLRFALAADGGSKPLKRMMREIYAWSKLDHENIHQLLGVTILQGQLGMVSEWMTNGNLRHYLGRNPGVDRYKLCIQIAQAVKYIHNRDMVHGDLKAANILVSSEGIIKLTDFDYSLMSDSSLLFTDTTRVGLGTLRWMAPELVIETSHQRSKRTDVYALGMASSRIQTFLEVITGAPPYYPECRIDVQVVGKLTQKALPERLLKYFPDNQQGNEVWKLLVRCWDYDPALRPTAEVVLASVASWLLLQE
ncbi:unnamed protein product [Rhizoctonia solani]|uniref:Protein kinase domain-containing protein n=1 Tax=Rhizoctonia solani TaxID=456999 RepID=A0A8H2Y073_9AGAM|nr:unnamed protein product [Rhizoctonia solani]